MSPKALIAWSTVDLASRPETIAFCNEERTTCEQFCGIGQQCWVKVVDAAETFPMA
jgi:hypothetical protein